MNVEATLAAIAYLTVQRTRFPEGSAEWRVLGNATYHLAYGLRQYLTRGEGKD